MTASELIEELKKYPPNMRVIVHGYEGGYHDAKSLHEKDISLNVNSKVKWYYGPHDDAIRGRKNNETALLVSPDDSVEKSDWVPL